MKISTDYYPEGRQMALFLDMDNYWINNDSTRKIDSLLNALRPWGKIVERRAYGTSLPKSPWLYRELVYRRFSISELSRNDEPLRKNGVYIQIAVEMMDMIHTCPGIKTFVLISNNGDFVSLVERLHQYGRSVIGIGSRKNSPKSVEKVFDVFLYLEDILRSSDAAFEPDIANCSVPCTTSPDRMKTLLRKRNLYPPEPMLRKKILSHLHQMAAWAVSRPFCELQEKLSEQCHAIGISNRAVRNCLRGLCHAGCLVEPSDIPLLERPVLSIPDPREMENALCRFLVDTLLSEPNLLADPLTISLAVWDDTTHVREIESLLKKTATSGQPVEK